MEDRFGPPPEEARRLVQLMALKTELAARLKALGCEANARSVTLHLRHDTPLDPAKVTELVRKSEEPLPAHSRHAPDAAIRTGPSRGSRTRRRRWRSSRGACKD